MFLPFSEIIINKQINSIIMEYFEGYTNLIYFFCYVMLFFFILTLYK